jgi:hypothetical protein
MLALAGKSGEDFEQTDPATGQSQRHYEPIPFKTLKELKEACTMYGATAPLTQQLLNSIPDGSAFPPDDWMAIAKACLGPGDYLRWKTSYTELCKEQATRNAAHGIPITTDLLLGQGDHTGLQNPLNYPPLTCDQTGIAAIRA